MGQKNTAMGLWGQDDYRQMKMAVKSLGDFVRVKMTTVPGGTRQNVTVVDTAGNREMHLRGKNNLVSAKALGRLETELQGIVRRGDVCVFSGVMPADELLADAVRIVRFCRGVGAKVVVDTYGPALNNIIEGHLAWLIKPNVDELSRLLGGKVRDSAGSLAAAGRRLLDEVPIVLISRGVKGAVLVTKEGAWQGRAVVSRKVLSTVGCGDYLLAGFLKAVADGGNFCSAIGVALKVATAHALGWTQTKSWGAVQRSLRIGIESL
jgi:fructose-1-phosphate kinase PfkB-like protein